MSILLEHIIQFNGIKTNNPVHEFIYSSHTPPFITISSYITKIIVMQHSKGGCRKSSEKIRRT